MSERLNKAHLIICTIAAAVIAGGFVAQHVYDVSHGLFTMAMWVSIAIVLFYFIGHIVRSFLISKVFVAADENNGQDENAVAEELLDEEIMVTLDEETHDDTMYTPPQADTDTEHTEEAFAEL